MNHQLQPSLYNLGKKRGPIIARLVHYQFDPRYCQYLQRQPALSYYFYLPSSPVLSRIVIMLSIVHSHYSQQHYVPRIQAPKPTVALSALSHLQLPVPWPVPSSCPHRASSHASSQPPALGNCDPCSAFSVLSMPRPALSVAEGSSAAAQAQAQARTQAVAMQTQQLKQDASVAQALEIARESSDGASDPTISRILENAISNIWTKIMARPEGYIMTREEFSVFNFFQHRFESHEVAIAARKRYWDNFSSVVVASPSAIVGGCPPSTRNLTLPGRRETNLGSSWGRSAHYF